jgi:hypothetical protein
MRSSRSRTATRCARAGAAELQTRARVAERAGMRADPSQTASTLARAVGEGIGPAPGGATSL